MKDNDLLDIWKSYDQKLDQVLSLNKKLTFKLTKDNLNSTINRLKIFKVGSILIGIPYLVLLYFITFIGVVSGSVFVALGFGTISIITSIVTIAYFYQIYLISLIKKDNDIVHVQSKISALKISSFKTARIAILQLPFWTLCWISLNALKESPLIYGGVNFILFIAFSLLAYWLYINLNINKMDTKINKFFFSGIEWDPIIKSSEILAQLKEYE